MKYKMTSESERFQSDADKYAAYLETPEGRLRVDLAFANLQEFLPEAITPLRALDLGCGTGAMAVRLARLGHHVTGLDFSLPMLDFARRAARDAGLTERIELKHGDAGRLTDLFRNKRFDLILCHNVFEFVDDPAAALRNLARLLRDSSAILSSMVRTQSGEILKAAVQSGDLATADACLTAQWGCETLYGGKVRLFTPESLHAMLKASSLTAIAERGVRIVSDYLPPQVSRSDEYGRIFDLERKLGRRPDFAGVARYLHSLARRTDPSAGSAA